MIIGISGKIGSGKTHTARYIENHLPEYKFQKKSYGYNVKKIASILTGISMKTILSRKSKNIYLPEWNMNIGQMFQKIGTDCMRFNLHPDTWLLSMFATYSEDQNWVVDDVRFVNEADLIKEKGGIIIRVEGDPKGVRVKDNRDPNHPSETSLDNYNRYDIIFDSEKENLDDLIKQIKNII
jgi:hypothetical protein